MSEKRNFAALDWVIDEIGDTLKDARQALEAYVEDSKDSTKMRFCLTYIHQVHGSLQMVEFHGASLLAEEMEHLAQALMESKVTSVPEAQEVLMRSLLQLPTYLDHVKAQKEDNPGLVLPLLNDLRAVRNQSYLSETNLFSPDLSSVNDIQGSRHPITTDKAKLQQVLKKLREMYQFAAASVLRGIKVEENLVYLDKVFSRLEALTVGTACYPIWEVSAALIEGLLRDDIELSVAVRGLLRHLARELRVMGEKAPGALDFLPRESLLKNLLYYVARAEAGGKKINRVKARYNLDHALLDGVTIGDSNDRESLSAPDPEAIRSVVVALKEEINTIKHALDLCLSGHGAPEDLREVLPVVKRVADTLAVLGIGDLRKQVNAQTDVLSALSEKNSFDENSLMGVAGKIIEIEHRLEAIAKVVGTNRDLDSVNEREIEIDQAKVTVIKECQHGLEQAKDAIVEYISSKWDSSHLLNVGSLLHDIRGGLEMIPLVRPANILDRCAAYIQEQLINGDAQPSWQSLDTLADAIASVEYFLERLLDDMEGDSDALLDVAEQSVASLGYPLSGLQAAPTPVSDTTSAEQDVAAPVSATEQTDAVAETPESPSADEKQPTLESQTPESSLSPTSVSLESISVDDGDEDLEDSDIDDEIVEIFIEEAGEVRETLEEYFPLWRANQQDQDSLVVVRRAFHTLKGSGRMVEAHDIGELAWSIENMLNRVIDNTVSVGPPHAHIITLALHLLPVLVDAFANKKKNPQKPLTEQYMAWAQSMSEGNIPPELASIPAGENPPLPDLSVRSAQPAAAPKPEAATSAAQIDEEESENLVLWEIFSSEAQTHLATMEAFIAEMEKEAPLFSPPSDDFQRALHTLKGSAKMAQVNQIAAMAEPLEGFAKELISFQEDINEDILQLYRDCVSYTREGLSQIEAGQVVEIRQVDQFVARTAELRELAVGHLIRLKEMEKDGQKQVDPRLLSIFMAEEMNLLLDSDQIISEWQQQGSDFQQINPVIAELNTLETGAEQANLPDMAALSAQLRTLYEQVQAGQQALNEDYFAILSAGHNALLDMVDAVAAGQNVVAPPQEITSALASLIHNGTLLPAMQPVTPEDASAADSLSNTDTDTQQTEADDDTGASSEDEELVIEFDSTPASNVITGDFSGGAPTPSPESVELVDEDAFELHIPDEHDQGDEALDLHVEDEHLTESDDNDAGMELVEEDDDTSDFEIEFSHDDLPADLPLVDEDELAHSETSETELTDDSAPAQEDSPPDEPVLEELTFDELPQEISEGIELNDGMLEEPFQAETPEAPPQESVEMPASEQSEAPVEESGDAPEDAEPQVAVSGLLDPIDVNHPDFDQDILEIFLEEAEELIEQLDEAVHTWEGDWSDLSQAEEIKRVLHTLKGGARLAGMGNLGELTHNYESFLIASDLNTVDDPFFQKMHAYQDRVLSGVRAIQAFMSGDLQAAPATDTVPDEPAAELVPDTPAAPPEALAAAAGTAADSNIVPFAPKPKTQDQGEFSMPSVSGGGGGQAAVRKPSGPQEVVKVAADLLEELVNLAGETSINRARIEQQVNDFSTALEDIDATLFRLQEQLRRLDIETEAQVLFRQEQMAAHEDFDPLEMDRYSQLQQLSRSLIESASDLIDLRQTLTDNIRDTETLLLQQSRINTTLQEGLMRSRMVPFSRLVPRLRRIVRQVAGELGKNVSFELDNVEGELDRSVLERMVPPLEHMLRNAVDHGIELPEKRLEAGKSETGRIVLTLGREGGDVILRLADDGRGVDLRRVREKAIERGLMTADAELSDFDIMQFILHAGFSTAEQVTQISGRGVGMDVVTSEIKGLGGSVTINSQWGKGTEFIVRLPFTVSVNRALMVEIGQDMYAIPLNTIEGIVRVSPFELEHYYTTEEARFEYAGENYQVRYLGSMLNAELLPQLDGHALPLPVLLVRSADNTMAVQVDNLLGSREVVVKSLGSQFNAVQGLSGATLMGDGSVVVILDPHALMRKEMANANIIEMKLREESARLVVLDDTPKTIMVVDDSVTVRKVTSRFLEREGFNVLTAKDGVDALRILQEEIPDLMLLDIEMPRMDGFEVAKNVRNSSRLNHLPIIMITSRTGEKHREHAMSLGVNNYLGKPYQEDLLLTSITELLEPASRG